MICCLRTMARVYATAVLLLALLPVTAPARPVTEQQVRAAVQGWLAADDAPLGQPLGIRLRGLVPRAGEDGNIAYWVAYLDPNGFVLVSGDDTVEPILGFGGNAADVLSADNPLTRFVSADTQARLRTAAKRPVAHSIHAGAYRDAAGCVGWTPASKWTLLTEFASGRTRVAAGIPELSDHRVDPLYLTKFGQDIKWGQGNVPADTGGACYNYYTPRWVWDQTSPPAGHVAWDAGNPENYVCGCVATAMAMLMRYHEHPTIGVGVESFIVSVKYFSDPACNNCSCATNTAWVGRSLRGGHGVGDPYAWSDMPLSPSDSMTENERQAIGTLCHDAGIAVAMDYGRCGSGAVNPGPALRDVFMYQSVVRGCYGIEASLIAMANPNLDAGYPVLMAGGGHAFICDGYGYQAGTMYHHINMGWDGNDTLWYNLSGSEWFLPIGECFYNVYPAGTGEIISGRVTDPDGQPIKDCTVIAQALGGGVYTATTDKYGIYALPKLPSARQFTIDVQKPGYNFCPRVVTTGTSVNDSNVTGNLWAVDFVPAQVYHVAPWGSDSNSGANWDDAMRTIQHAVDAAGPNCEVWVAAGVYDECIFLKNGVCLYGGFAGTETSRDQRDWKTNVTVLDGGQGESVVTIVSGAGPTTVVDGFTIRNGNGYNGGGIRCGSGSPTITNNVITGNASSNDGGGIYCEYGSPVISHNVCEGNQAGHFGGGIYGGSVSAPSVTTNVVKHNTARYGGGIMFWGGSPVVAGNLIVGNAATDSTDGAGGVYFIYTSGGTIVANTICHNTSKQGAGVMVYYVSSPTISNNVVAFNSNGIYSVGSTPTLSHNCVYGNPGYDYQGLSRGASDISADPLFVDKNAGDYHLTPESPCIDAGDDSVVLPGWLDMDGQPRIAGQHVDIGADEYWNDATSIADARLTGDRVGVRITGAVVSAAFGDFFYIESNDRACGIRVEKTGHGLVVGDRADVYGMASTTPDGERCIVASAVTRSGTGSIYPLGMNNRWLGGGDWLFNPDTGAGQRGITGSVGLNNIGLLVTVWGRITERDSASPAKWFKIDDGSGIGVKCVVPSGVVLDPGWSFVRVTGVSSCEKVGDELHRLIRVRMQDDIVAF